MTKINDLFLQLTCNKQIEWYKSVKETQGSVETTSYGQMDNILKYGIYRVGFRKNSLTVHDLVSVTLKCKNKGDVLFKQHYSLEELRDLESKLVLICGDKAENRAEVDHYLNVSTYRTNKSLCLHLTLFSSAAAQCYQDSRALPKSSESGRCYIHQCLFHV